MTTFCDLVTKRCEARISRRRPFATKVMGEAMAPASESNKPSGGNNSGVGAKLSLLLALGIVVFWACNDDSHHAAPLAVPTAAQPSVADPATGITTELDGIAPEFGDAVIAELAGDDTAARVAFEHVLQAPDAPARIAARAALHLAQLDARAGKSRDALDLSARAAALAPNDSAITEGVAQIQAQVVAASGGGDLRGPKAGEALAGVDPKVADAFAAAERALVRVHAMHPRQRLEVWAKEDATEEVIAMYRAVKDKGGVAQVAADFRIGSLYHDLALGLLFGGVAELRVRALAYLKSAAAQYRASLAGPQVPETELWRLAAETDLRNAQDVLTAAGASG
ncbi:MAG TPA: hypothetical protein VF403_01865 [Kofleriaceae bacterium]